MVETTIKVAVRVRPFTRKELAGTQPEQCPPMAVSMDESTVTLHSEVPKSYLFDYGYCSVDATLPIRQEDVYRDLGVPVAQHAIEGYNGTLFAYGQTGSGKSYTIMGYGDQPGFIPRIVDDILKRKTELEADPLKELRIWVSYIEIYNEHVRDLLDHDNQAADLKILDHPTIGVCIPNLTEAVCNKAEDVSKLLKFGMKRRVVAATNMNATSSRSHAVFILKVQHLEGTPPRPGQVDERKALNAKINLTDLAGSERMAKSGAEGTRLREGNSINQSLSTLALIIKELGETATMSKKSGEKIKVAFRASKLTFLLKDSLAGNSRTYMIACVSPAMDALPETASTLRFASSVKRVETFVTQNRNQTSELIESLRAEIRFLKSRKDSSLSGMSSMDSNFFLGEATPHVDAYNKVRELEAMLAYQQRDYEMQLQQALHAEEARSLEFESGLSDRAIHEAFHVDTKTPYLLNMSDDPMVAGCLIYFLSAGASTTVGADVDNKIVLKGVGIADHLCQITNAENNFDVTIEKLCTGGRINVNGRLLKEREPRKLRHGDKVYFGRALALKLIVPLDESSGRGPANLSLEELEDEWSALEDSVAWGNLQEYYLKQVLGSMSPDQASVLFEEMKKGCKLCDEANEITMECRSEENLHFEVDLTSSVPSSIVIRVLQADVANGKSHEAPSYTTIYLWSVPQLDERLERMRDYHQVVVNQGSDVALDPLLDPWHEPHPVAIAARLTELEVRVAAERQNALQLKRAKKSAMSKYMYHWVGAEDDFLGKFFFQSWALLTKNLRSSQKEKKTVSGVLTATGLRMKPTLSGVSQRAVTKSEVLPTPRGRGSGAVERGSPNTGISNPKLFKRPQAASPPPERNRGGVVAGRSSRNTRRPGTASVPDQRTSKMGLGQASRMPHLGEQTESVGPGVGVEVGEGIVLEDDRVLPQQSSEPAGIASRSGTSPDTEPLPLAGGGFATGAMPSGPSAPSFADPFTTMGAATSSAAPSADGRTTEAIAADNASLRKQLEAAWQLCNELRVQMQEQEKMQPLLRSKASTIEEALPTPPPQRLHSAPVASSVATQPPVLAPVRVATAHATPRSVGTFSPEQCGNFDGAGNNATHGSPLRVSGTSSPNNGGTSAEHVAPGAPAFALHPSSVFRPRSHSPLLRRHMHDPLASPRLVSYPAVSSSTATAAPVAWPPSAVSAMGNVGFQPTATMQLLPSPGPATSSVATVPTMSPRPNAAVDLFAFFDSDGDGVITRSEFASRMLALTPRISPSFSATSTPQRRVSAASLASSSASRRGRYDYNSTSVPATISTSQRAAAMFPLRTDTQQFRTAAPSSVVAAPAPAPTSLRVQERSPVRRGRNSTSEEQVNISSDQLKSRLSTPGEPVTSSI